MACDPGPKGTNSSRSHEAGGAVLGRSRSKEDAAERRLREVTQRGRLVARAQGSLERGTLSPPLWVRQEMRRPPSGSSQSELTDL